MRPRPLYPCQRKMKINRRPRMSKPAMSRPVPLPPADDLPDSAVDASGRLIPISPEEQRARARTLTEALSEMEAVAGEGDDDATWVNVFRGIDEARPHRPTFEGSY